MTIVTNKQKKSSLVLQSLLILSSLFIFYQISFGGQVQAFKFTFASSPSSNRNIPIFRTFNIPMKLAASSSSSSFTSSSTSPNKMEQQDQSGPSSADLPNWRTILPEQQDQQLNKPKIPPFAHQSSSTSSSTTSSSIINASWSKEQYQQSLKNYNKFISCTDSYIAPYISNALSILLHAYRLYKPMNVIGSFNGGKDAVVIVELMKAAHAKYYYDLLVAQEQEQQQQQQKEKNSESQNLHDIQEEKEDCDDNIPYNASIIRPRTVYFNHKLEFPEVYDFVFDTVVNYDFDMIAFHESISFVQGLDKIVKENHVMMPQQQPQSQQQQQPQQQYPLGFVLGTRDTDPNAGGQGYFAPSSTWMPPFMRVNPILDWTYGHIWHFLRLYKLPYCSLYDEGYTSLGNVKDTLPCPALMKVKIDGDGDNNDIKSKYWPAYMLKDWDKERAGRIKKEKKKKDTDTTNNKNDTNNHEDTIKKKKGEEDATTTGMKDENTIPITKSDSSLSFLKMDEKISKQKNEGTKESSPSFLTKEPSIELKEKDDNANEQISSSKNDATEKKEPLLPSSSSSSSSSSSYTGTTQRTVGLVIIGDEILKGLTPDTNTHAAASALKSNNVPLAKVSVVSDDLNEIVNEIEYMSSLVDVIITSGGVGPTHDDVTIKSVGKALNSEMVLNKKMAELLQSKMKKTNNDTDDDDDDDKLLTEAQTKMATLPACSKLRYLSTNKNDWPVLQCRHIFILPGVPQFFEKKVQNVASYLSTELERTVAFKVVLSIDENSIVPILNHVVSNHPNVSFGSYPFVNHPEYKTVVTLEGRRVEGGTLMNSSLFLSMPPMSDFDLDNDKEEEETLNLEPYRFDQNEIDLNVKVALADLVNGMPEGSVLRVDNNNDLTF